MFGTQWAYALGEMVAALVIYVYIGQANPGYFPGEYCIVRDQIMFGTQMAYALGGLVAALVMYVYIGQANPG